VITVPQMADMTPRPCPVCGEVIDLADHDAALEHAVKDDEHIKRLLRTPPSSPTFATETNDGKSIPQHHQRRDGQVPS
jgi:hypothetical protein